MTKISRKQPAQRSNTKAKSVVKLHSGVDTLGCTHRYMLCTEVLEQVREAQRRARALGAGVSIDIAGKPFTVESYGGRHGFDLLFSNDHLSFVARSTPVKIVLMPNVMATLGSDWLNADDWTAVWDFFESFTNGILERREGEPVSEWQVARADVFADIQGWKPTTKHYKHWLMQPRLKRAMYGQGRQVTGMQVGAGRKHEDIVQEGERFGQGDIVLRIYNKTKEIMQASKKWFFRDLWEQVEGFDPESDVWRIEFQLRREALKSFRHPDAPTGLRTVPEIAHAYEALWRYLCGEGADGRRGWISLRVPTYATRGERRYKARLDQWNVHQAWQAIRDFAVADEPMRRVNTRRLRNAEGLLPSFKGYGSTVLALEALAPFGDVDKLAAEMGSLESVRMIYGRKIALTLKQFWSERLDTNIDEEDPGVIAEAMVKLWIGAGVATKGGQEAHDALLDEVRDGMVYECEQSSRVAAIEKVSASLIEDEWISLAPLEPQWAIHVAGLVEEAQKKMLRKRGMEVWLDES